MLEIQVVRALYDFTATNPEELSFKEGAILYVLNKDDSNWWKCKCEDKIGYVPFNYVGENTAQIDNPLHEAAKRGNISFARELIDAGVSLNGLDKAGNSPLHWAARGGHYEVVEMLLKKNAAYNSQPKDTPLHMAAWGGHDAIIKILLQQKDIKTNFENKEGKKALDLAKTSKCGALLLEYANIGNAADLAGDDDDED